MTGTAGTSTFSGMLLGVATTFTCSGASFVGVLDNNSAGTVSGHITAASWTGCSTNVAGPCNFVAVGLPWDMTDGGGLQAVSTTSVGWAPGARGSVSLRAVGP